MLLASTALAKKLMPGLGAEVQAYMTAYDVAEERENGRLTQRAKDMRQRLRNPYFETTHKAKAHSIAKKNRAKAAKDVGPKVASAVEAVILYMQSEQVVADLENEAEDGPKSRKQELTFEHSALQAFADEMNDRQVPPHQLGLLSNDHLEVIAKIVRYSMSDPDCQDPLNPLFVLARHGDLHAMRNGMTSDEAWMMAEVYEEKLEPAWLKRREDLELRAGRPLQILPAFAASMERLVSAAESMSEGEGNRLWVARGRAFEEQAEVLAAILGGTIDVRKCAALLAILQDGISWTDEHYRVSLTFKTLESIVRDMELREVPPEDWVADLWQDLWELDGYMRKRLTRPEQFYAILAHVIAGSREMRRYYAERTEGAVYDTVWAPCPNYRYATEEPSEDVTDIDFELTEEHASEFERQALSTPEQSRALVRYEPTHVPTKSEPSELRRYSMEDME